MARVLIAILAWIAMAVGSTAVAQQALPEFRYIATRDMDFYGADLDSLFGTDLQSCVRACSANPQCGAFTFNSRSNACFPKRGVQDMTPFVGAVSARKIATEAGISAVADTRAQALPDLRGEVIDDARALARDIGLRHFAGDENLQLMIEAAINSRARNDTAAARNWIGAAISLADRADLWVEYARLSLRLKPNRGADQRRAEADALSAAINGYLRDPAAAGRASALLIASQALERMGRGREMIPILRLAISEHPRAELEEALDTAIGKYGFRVTDTEVESDSAAPRICARFSEPLINAGVDYDPFVRLDDQTLVVQPNDTQLCIDGVSHGSRYRVTFRAGLPAASGETLARDVTITQYVRDRAPNVAFPGRAYVLPRAADAALPVETVNLTALDLTLRRVSDRNLLRAMQQGYFARPLSQWELEDFSDNVAQDVWTGTADVPSELNRTMTVRLPMGQAIADQPPGIYALTARVPGADPYDDPGATQWFVLSDLGISTMSGTDGLHVDLRGLSDAAAREGIEVTLVSRANSVLGTATTDAEGRVDFAAGLTRGAGAAAPALVLASDGESDLGFLSLIDPAFDLSDRGVEGRAPAGPVDVFLATDRGAYRAGETINATVLARDAGATAIEGLPLMAVLSRPDGVEYRRLISDGGHAGGHVFSFATGGGVPRGTWRIDIKTDPKSETLASQTVLVEDFLPERIDFDLSLPDAPIFPGDRPALGIDARYLFGAPGADLTIEGFATLRAADSVAGWDGYRFGRFDDETQSRTNRFGGERTDAAGQARVALELPEPDTKGRPLTLDVVARLADGSARPVERRISAPVRPDGPVIGIRPMFDGVVAEGSAAQFRVIALSPDLTPAPMRVKWTLNRLNTRYQWYQLYGEWNYERTTRRSRVASGEAEIGTDPLALETPVDWGQYELVVERIGGDYTASSVDFYAGWYAPAAGSDTPDRLQVSLDRADYAVGDTARLRVVARHAGTALVSVLSDHVIARQVVDLPEGDSLIPLTVQESWGAGAYVAVSLIRPMDVAAGQNPARSLGIAHAKVAPGDKALQVSIDAPEVARPRQTQTIGVQVDGAREGDEVWLTLAAVDLGILNLTGYQAPDPQGYYFGQRRLGVDLRDVYGRLIDGMSGAMADVRSGGDADQGARMQSPPPTQDLMAVFSGPVQVGPDGRAEVDVKLPPFNGTVRLMAVAWSRTGVGQASRDMIVRDPVVVTASVPNFLAPGDTSRIRLDVAHADGPAGEMGLAITRVGGELTVGAVATTLNLAEGQRTSLSVPVTGIRVGDPTFDVVLTTPDGQALTQTLRLPVRANDPVVAQTQQFALAGGSSFAFTPDVFDGLRPGTGKAILSAGPIARFNAPALLEQLDRYPYGCTEQVTSAAMPLLYLSSVARATGLGDGPAVEDRIDAAIARVLARQAPNGAFGLWRAEAGNFWLDAYVSDFLSRARDQGHAVPDLAYRLAMDNLRNRISYAADFDSGGEDIAYALMILAREGTAAMGDLRYYADVKGDAFSTPLAAAQVGAALASYGDQMRADAMFARAARMIAADAAKAAEAPVWRADFGTDLRDSAAVLALATEAGSTAIDRTALLTRVTAPGANLSTQEAAWTLMAARALIAAPGSGLQVNGAPVEGPFVRVLEDDAGDGGLSIAAADGQTTDVMLTTFGVPVVAPEAGGTGYRIDRSYLTTEGAPLDVSSLTVGQRFVTVLRVTPFENGGARLMIDDPLPAGVEIDNPNLLRAGDMGALDGLSLSDATHSEFRSDRFLSAIDLRDGQTITLAYVARAVTPGDFHHPAASVEDMYRPRYRARTDTGRVVIAE